MTRNRALKQVLLVAVAVLGLAPLTGCSDGSAGQSGPEAGAALGGASSRVDTRPAACPELTLSGAVTYDDSFFGSGAYAPLVNVNDAGYGDNFGMRLKSGYGYLDDIPPYEQVAGTFDFTNRLEQDGRTCRHCVYVLSDVSGDHIQLPYIATSGTLELTSVNVDTGEFVGKLDKILFREISEIAYYSWAAPLENGRCLWLSQLTIDTRSVAGGSCKTNEDCPNAKLQACTAGKCQ